MCFRLERIRFWIDFNCWIILIKVIDLIFIWEIYSKKSERGGGGIVFNCVEKERRNENDITYSLCRQTHI